MICPECDGAAVWIDNMGEVTDCAECDGTGLVGEEDEDEFDDDMGFDEEDEDVD